MCVHGVFAQESTEILRDEAAADVARMRAELGALQAENRALRGRFARLYARYTGVGCMCVCVCVGGGFSVLVISVSSCLLFQLFVPKQRASEPVESVSSHQRVRRTRARVHF